METTLLRLNLVSYGHSAECSLTPAMDMLGPLLAAAGRLVGHDANAYCDQFNVTYEHRVDDPGAPQFNTNCQIAL